MARHFASVVRHDGRSELVVTDVAAVVDYVASGWALALAPDSPRPRVLELVERRVREVIGTEGAFRIRTDVGCFECR